jgi:hypothetical protein
MNIWEGEAPEIDVWKAMDQSIYQSCFHRMHTDWTWSPAAASPRCGSATRRRCSPRVTVWIGHEGLHSCGLETWRRRPISMRPFCKRSHLWCRPRTTLHRIDREWASVLHVKLHNMGQPSRRVLWRWWMSMACWISRINGRLWSR